MSFSEEIASKALVACARCCCICNKFVALKIELHHIVERAAGGGDTFENCIPLCFNCHADMRSYDHKHPKGRKYTRDELIQHRDRWYRIVASGQSRSSFAPEATISIDNSNKRLDSTLEWESNPRFGFSFAHPSTWDRDDPTNADGNCFHDPLNPQVEIAAWGGYAVLSPDLYSWVEQTIGFIERDLGFRLITRIASGGHIFDFDTNEADSVCQTRQQVEGIRVVYTIEEKSVMFTVMQKFFQHGKTQFSIMCKAPSKIFDQYEGLFLDIATKFRILGPKSAPFARGNGK